VLRCGAAGDQWTEPVEDSKLVELSESKLCPSLTVEADLLDLMGGENLMLQYEPA